jgi:hypothetical protein
MIRNNFIFILILLALTSCRGKITVGNQNTLNNDTNCRLDSGFVKSMDKNNNLINITYYYNEKMNGSCINYYPNGKISDSGYYKDNLTDGYWTFFDSLGSKTYSNFYYKNLEYGPQLWYSENVLHKFNFLTFDKKTLVSITYNKTGDFDSLISFNMGLNIYKKNDHRYNLFAYLPKIPNTNQFFAIGIRNKLNTKELYPVSGDIFLIDTLLVPPPEGWNYYLSCHIQSKYKYYNKIFMEQYVFDK